MKKKHSHTKENIKEGFYRPFSYFVGVLEDFLILIRFAVNYLVFIMLLCTSIIVAALDNWFLAEMIFIIAILILLFSILKQTRAGK